MSVISSKILPSVKYVNRQVSGEDNNGPQAYKMIFDTTIP
jgi:hypothetical protein